MPKPPGMFSVTTASRVTTPWRARSCCVIAARPSSWHRVLRARRRLVRGVAADQHPPPFGRRRREAARAERSRRHGTPPPAPRRAAARERAQRVKGIVGDEPAPHEIPQRRHGLAGIAAADRLVQRSEEGRTTGAQRVEDGELAFERSVCPAEAGHHASWSQDPRSTERRACRSWRPASSGPAAAAATIAADDPRDTARCGRRDRRAARRRPTRLRPPPSTASRSAGS